MTSIYWNAVLLAMLLVVSGCTTTQPAPTPTVVQPTTYATATPSPTELQTPITTMIEQTKSVDETFANQMDACVDIAPIQKGDYAAVIRYKECTLSTIIPEGFCAKNYRHEMIDQQEYSEDGRTSALNVFNYNVVFLKKLYHYNMYWNHTTSSAMDCPS